MKEAWRITTHMPHRNMWLFYWHKYNYCYIYITPNLYEGTTMIYLMVIPGIIINYLILTTNLPAYPKPLAVILMIMCLIPFLNLILKGITYLIKKLPSLDGFCGYILALIFGTRIMGKLEPGQIRILHEAKGNPFAEDEFDNYVKVIDIKNGYVKYARYSKHTNEFTYILTNNIRTFMYMYPIATTNLDKFT